MMNIRQRGFSLFSMIFVGGIIALLALLVMQVVPSVMEYFTIQKVVKKVSNAGTTVPEIRVAFDRFASVDAISSITGKDLEVSKFGDKIVVSFAYNKEIHLAGPVYLLMKYQGTSGTGK
jgi:Domain of unknown function (DUF4845)